MAEAELPSPADQPAPEPVPEPAKPKYKAVPKPRGSSAFDAELAALLNQIYAEYDFQQAEGPAGLMLLDLWTLPAGSKGAAPAAAATGKRTSLDKSRWPERAPHGDRPRDYRLHACLSTTKDPSWAVPGKEVQAICADRTAGLLLLMADQKGFFLPSHRLRDLCELFTPAAVFKITSTRLRKTGIARFFSLAGFARELADAQPARPAPGASAAA